ncbi:MAG: oxygen-independent coproporphyrinogen III oxidase [Candidatus Omnitrophota bacterium]
MSNAASAIQTIDPKMIEKYSLRGPRYTSYPTAPEWTEEVGADIYWKHVRATNQSGASCPLSIYIHIPFCGERCYYCACNVIITQSEKIMERYVDSVSREAQRTAQEIAPGRRVIQFHLGGGTPTHLPPPLLERLLSKVTALFEYDEDSERSIEVDSRVTSIEHLQVLRRFGFNRISLGVEDFFAKTQEAINRPQDAEETNRFAQDCRRLGFESVNIDLVYGLPFQTLKTFHETLDIIYRIDPDRIALYNYAHLPEKVPHQRKIEETSLPNAQERTAILKAAIEGFTERGYAYIGMDHFAKPDDELTLSQKEGTLQRNFMGFTTRAGADLYAFGVSAISSLPALYAQNEKNLKQYTDKVERGEAPIERGVELTPDDRMRRWVIMELMCNLRVSAERFRELWGEDFHRYFAQELQSLQPFAADGLLEPDMSQEIRVTDIGQIIIRPIAMAFDRRLALARQRGGQTAFSKTL